MMDKPVVPILLASILPVAIAGAATPALDMDGGDPSLSATIKALDAAAFDDFNHCDDPARLRRHAGYFSQDVEFYHDTGGVTWTREQMLANTERHACGNYRRELVGGTFRVHPIKNFGAIAQGTHRFCSLPAGACEGLADFTIVWKKSGDAWTMTRVLSYGHRAAPAPGPGR